MVQLTGKKWRCDVALQTAQDEASGSSWWAADAVIINLQTPSAYRQEKHHKPASQVNGAHTGHVARGAALPSRVKPDDLGLGVAVSEASRTRQGAR